MTKGLYVVYDVVAKNYLPVFESFNDNAAVRDILGSFKNNPNIDIGDYKLFKVGCFSSSIPQNDDDCSRFDLTSFSHPIEISLKG